MSNTDDTIELVENGAELKPREQLDLSNTNLRLGIDVGSTTVKLAVIDDKCRLIYANYERHHTDIRATAKSLFELAREAIGDVPMRVSITGSGGMLLAKWLDVEFVQEVIASKRAVETLIPQTDCAIELGGEDAKIIYFDNGIEQRMNGTCAGGTGAFIDQMATFLHTDAMGLNELAKGAKQIHPIASRCGVFAKSDVQPLLNEGARPEDVAASIFQSVVTQTVSGLACGHPIRGYVAFLGGPLQYLSELRKRFYITLDLDEEHRIVPENAHLFVATGAALAGESDKYVTFSDVIRMLDSLKDVQGSEVARLDPLFATEEDYKEFKERHNKEVVPKGDLSSYHGRVFIGIDAGSTTMKCAVVGEDGELLYTWYGNNNGDVLGTARKIMDGIYDVLPADCTIGHVTTTGYGEGILIQALRADSGEIETVAHLRGAKAFIPDVEFILDIGGQDMKCLQVKNGVIEHIMLNEACSSGCGSFIESFATSMDMSVQEFAKAAVQAKSPVDLGSRCTVFMNSRVKQAQKEGASIGDVAAGLSYSVIKNALFKVIKLRDFDEIGKYCVVQGGTFMSDATLRAFELLTGRKVIRPDIAGCMGAYGAALLARDRAGADGISTILSREAIDNLKVKHTNVHCGRCSNNCLLTINDFGEGRRFITGNRCEKGAGRAGKKKNDAPNLFEFKNKLLFDRPVLDRDDAPRGTVGIPRALNMYENYPFWHAFFTKLGFSVILSDQTSSKTYEAGIESMPSESVCYPAKLSHGHIMNLLSKDPDFIWMPCIRWERKEDETATNHYNCPIVMSYPQALGLNVDELSDPSVEYLSPFVPYDDKRELKRRLYELISVQREEDAKKGKGRFKGPHITRTEIDEAVNYAWQADIDYKNAMHRAGDEALRWIEEHNAHGIVLAGRPYHNDPEINHAIPELVHSFGFAVLTEDSVAHKMSPERPIRVVDQWMFHSRLYRAARFVASRNDLDLIQLFSFGCGLDALTTDEVQEILEASGKIYTCLKIDQVSNLGAARIRIRSLMAALKEQQEELARETAKGEAKEVEPVGVHLADGSLERARKTDLSRRTPVYREAGSAAWNKVHYTQEMQDEGYTIIAPQMAPIHFTLFEKILNDYGYNVVVPPTDQRAVDAGLKYVNNDICYPSILVTGQIMAAIESGNYDLSKTAVLISQTGGGCRATNYIALIRKALAESGHGDIPVISLSVASNLDEDNPGFKIFKPGLLMSALYAMLYGDMIMQLLYRCRPYEATPGAANALYDECMARACKSITDISAKDFYALCQDTVDAFEHMPLVNDRSKPRVGVVGEILVKFHPAANNHVVDVIESEGCEANVPGLMDFFLFGMSNQINMKNELGTKWTKRLTHHIGIDFLQNARKPIDEMLEKSTRFEPYEPISDLAKEAQTVLSLCNTMGEGWLLTAEMIDLIKHGTPNIVCAQPFACLPNHVVGKSVIKRLRQMYPESNIVAVDYDPGASEVNQLNRIKLMISVAKENYRNNEEGGFHLENPNDPTVHDAVMPYVDDSRTRYRRDSVVTADQEPFEPGRIHLTEEQLAQIEAAKRRAGVK